MEGESAQWQLQVWRDVALSPIQGTYLEAFCPRGLHGCVHSSLLHRDVGWCWLGTPRSNLLGWDDGGILWKSHALEHIFIGEREVALHLLLKLCYTPCQRCCLPPVGRSTFSTQNWWAQVYATIFSCWISQISWQAKDRIQQWQEILLAKTQWCR